MNVLFLTMLKISSIEARGIYTDLAREFTSENHHLYIVSPSERREKLHQKIVKGDQYTILRVNTLNLQKTSLVEKGIGQLLLEYQFLNVIKKNLKDVRFDLVLYTTPPITFTRVISFIKKRDNAFSYLLLKDIFPQNAVDLNMLKKNGMLYNFFRKKERALYRVSDKIGCMSPANVAYVLKHNPEVDKSKVEVNPNSIRPLVIEELKETRAEIREKYQLPSNKKIFVYGGNLGKPQGLEFLLEVIKASKHPEVFFLIVGSGTEYPKLLNWFKEQKPTNAKLLSGLPKIEYDELLTSCDVGLIFLSKEFTIPNFPSRLLSYLEMKMPVLAATDRNTDIGAIIEANNCGFGVESGNLLEAIDRINRLAEMKEEFLELQQNAVDLLERDYQVERTYDLIVKAVQANV